MALFFVKTYLVFFIIQFFSTNQIYAKKNGPPMVKCSVCTDLVNKLIEGLKKTSKGNFGGGNTAWEDKKLGSYLVSESRFEEISEKLCDEMECHQLLENHEDYVFDWYKNKQKRIESEFFEEFCIKHSKQCCPKEHYGPKCSPCKKNWDLICSGNGYCNGNGTSEGTGKCECNTGYAGELCDRCDLRYYETERNDSFVQCTACHPSCDAKCTGPTKADCDSCKKNSWIFSEETKQCEDADECKTMEKPCKHNTYCENTVGSYSCIECDVHCDGCTTKGIENCIGCKTGFVRNVESNLCDVDVDECKETPDICPKTMICRNNYGGYDCMVDESKYPNTSELPSNEDKTSENEKEIKKSEDKHTLKDDLEDYVEEKEAESPINLANLKIDL